MMGSENSATMAAMKDEAPPFVRNLRRIVDRDSAKTIADRAGLEVQRIYDYLSKSSVPRVETCIAIAKAANVPIEWLVFCPEDDAPIPYSSLAHLCTSDIADELRRRFYCDARELLDLYDRAEAIDWRAVWADVSKLEPGDPLPEKHRDAIEVAAKLGQFPHAKLGDFNVTDDPGSIVRSKFPEAESIDFDAINYRSLLSRTEKLRARRFGDVLTRLSSLQWQSTFDTAARWNRENVELLERIISHFESRASDGGESTKE